VSKLAANLHVPADITNQREPGTTVADNMTGAGALAAVLAVTAIGVPRLRAGLSLPPARPAPRA
jgi:hypothetical protein